jgi:serine/threonine protein kinase
MKRLGHYEIGELLGKGGMGEVYKARDTKLWRDAALKILPPEFAKDPARRQRFVQEAKSASALNHPNIITIYDIDTSDGVDYIAMEYVAGRTMDRLIPKQGMRTSEALRYAVQIADALAAAHAAGIIHRDLKPGNLMVTDSGLVKVLDFGLAKLIEKTGLEETTETMAPPVTEEGHILGTIAYMSPEQAQGLKLDARSDIFSFGAVLYEMLTGRRAFSGDTKMSTLAAILNREPQPLTPTTPRELDRIVTRCLRKDPTRRWQNMADLKVALEDLQEEADSGSLEASAIPVRKHEWRWLLASVAVALAAITIGGAWWFWNSTRTPTSNRSNLRQLTHDNADTSFPALSRDAKLVAYQSDRAEPGKYDIWVQQTVGGPPIRITKDADAALPVFSADGSKVYFTSWSLSPQGIYEVPALGGEPRLIVADAKSPSVSPDGASIAYRSVRTGQHYIMGTEGGQSQLIAPEFIEYVDTPPIWSPDGREILFAGFKRDHRTLAAQTTFMPDRETFDWWVAPTSGNNPERTGWAEWGAKRGQTAGSASAWLPDDTIVFWETIADTTRISLARIARPGWRIVGEPQPFTFGTAEDLWPSVAVGKMAFQSEATAGGIWSLPADTNEGRVIGPIERLTKDVADYKFAIPSSNGRIVVFASNRLGSYNIVRRDIDTGKETVVSTIAETRGVDIVPLITSDSSKVIFYVNVNGERDFISEVSAFGGASKRLCDKCGVPASLSPDGKQLLTQNDLKSTLLVNTESGRSAALFQGRLAGELFSPRFSPDSQWIAFLMTNGVLGASGEVVVAPFRGVSPVPQHEWITVASEDVLGGDVFWSPNGKLIYYSASKAGRYVVRAQRLDSSHHATGRPIDVYEFAGRVRPSLGVLGADFNRRLTAVPGHIIGTMYERTSNIWMLDLPK